MKAQKVWDQYLELICTGKWDRGSEEPDYEEAYKIFHSNLEEYKEKYPQYIELDYECESNGYDMYLYGVRYETPEERRERILQKKKKRDSNRKRELTLLKKLKEKYEK